MATAGLKVGRLEQLDRFHGGDSAPFGLRESLAAAVQGRPAPPVVCETALFEGLRKGVLSITYGAFQFGNWSFDGFDLSDRR